MSGGEDFRPPLDHEPRVVFLSEAQIDQIATRVEARFMQRFGRMALEKLLWLLGVVVVGAVIFLAGKGALPK